MHWKRLTPFLLSFLLSQTYHLKFKMCIKTRRILHYADFKTVGKLHKCLGKKCFGKLLQFHISFVFVNKFPSRTFVATLSPVLKSA